ncbi:hypothetical protein GQ457_01G043590 [Hibiscus cannabinus]
MELLEACKATKEADQDFVYDFTADQNDKVENIAWSYGFAVNSYAWFCYVVYFDTTYRSITCDMIFGAWFGIDNNGQPIFFGCVLLQDETLRSFAWALQIIRVHWMLVVSVVRKELAVFHLPLESLLLKSVIRFFFSFYCLNRVLNSLVEKLNTSREFLVTRYKILETIFGYMH